MVGEAFQWKSRGSQIGVHTFGHCLIGPLTFLHFQGSLFPLVLVGQSCSNPTAHTWDSPLSRPKKHNMKKLQCVKTMISLFYQLGYAHLTDIDVKKYNRQCKNRYNVRL